MTRRAASASSEGTPSDERSGSNAGPTVSALLAFGLAELSLLACLGWIPAAHRFPLPGLALFGAAFLAYVGAAGVIVKHARVGVVGRDTPPDRAKWWGGPGSPEVWIIWLVAIAMRLALLPLTPELSDDVYRYLWDGHVQLSGYNPYVYAPQAAELERVRTAWHHLINNPSVPTIYPPLAQVAFAFLALPGSSVLAAKILWLACDLATAGVLAGIARDSARDERAVLLLYLWAPLLVVEVAWSAHLEPLGLLMMALAIRWAYRARAFASGAGLALATLTKFAPVAALPALTRRHGWRSLLAFAVTVAVLYAPYASARDLLFTGLRTYGEHWWFMKGAFSLLEAVAGDPERARKLAGALVLGVIAWTTVRRFDLERALFWTLGAGMILTPTLHPWYVLWMLPIAALRGSRAWILLSGLAFIGYSGLTGYQETGEWAQTLPARAALWVPFLVVLAADALRAIQGDPRAEGR